MSEPLMQMVAMLLAFGVVILGVFIALTWAITNDDDDDFI
jgi:hypothetical protein